MDKETIIFLVTSQHLSWTQQAVGEDAVEKASREGRLLMIDSSGGDVADPYFGDEGLYTLVCAQLVKETPLSLETALLSLLRGIA